MCHLSYSACDVSCSTCTGGTSKDCDGDCSGGFYDKNGMCLGKKDESLGLARMAMMA